MLNRKPYHFDYDQDWLDTEAEIDDLAQRSILRSMNSLMYVLDGPVHHSTRWIAHRLHTSERTLKACLSQLIAAGHLERTADGIINRRAMREILARRKMVENKRFAVSERESKRVRETVEIPSRFLRDSFESPSRSGRESEKLNEINERESVLMHQNAASDASILNSRQEKEERKKEEEKVVVVNARAQAPATADAFDYENLQTFLTASAGKALADPAKSPGLLVIGEVRGWMQNGCDLQWDIGPAIRKVAARTKPGRVNAWAYFREAVFEARDLRVKRSPASVANGALPVEFTRTPEETLALYQARSAIARAERLKAMGGSDVRSSQVVQ